MACAGGINGRRTASEIVRQAFAERKTLVRQMVLGAALAEPPIAIRAQRDAVTRVVRELALRDTLTKDDGSERDGF